MLYNDLNYVNVANETELHTTLELKKKKKKSIFLNWIHEAKFPICS